jgi:hypothetical protein
VIWHLFTLEAVVPRDTSLLLEKAFEVRECFMIMLSMAFFSIIGVWTVGAGEFRAAHVKARGVGVGSEELFYLVSDHFYMK